MNDTVNPTSTDESLKRDGYELLQQDETFIDTVGPIWRHMAGADGATLRLQVAQRHINPNRTVHGGLLMTLMDLALGSATEAAAGAGGPAEGRPHPITLQLNCNMIGAAELGSLLEAHGRVDRLTRTLAFASGSIHAGERLLMTGSAVFKIPGADKPR